MTSKVDMKGAVVTFRLESHTSNVSSWHARTQKTHKFLSRESVVAGLTHTDWLIQETDTEYDPDFVYGDHPQFFATPAIPTEIEIRRQEVGAQMKAKDDSKPQEHLLAYGHRELIAPGSTFRALVWGDYPKLTPGDMILIGKERADAVIEEFKEHEVEKTHNPGIIHDLELMKIPRNGASKTEMDLFLERGDILRTTANTQRYSVVIGSADHYLRIGDWHVPLVEEVTV